MFHVDNHRDDLVRARSAARVSDAGARVGELSTTASDVVWILGIGFGLYILFGSIIPALFGAATKTKHSYKELRGHQTNDVHTRTHLKGHTPDDWDDYVASSRKSRSSVIDAEFEPTNSHISPYRDR